MFRSFVGGLNYLTHTRLDIAFSVSVVSRFLLSPTKQFLGTAKRILRYVAGRTEFCIWYFKVSNFILVGCTYSDYAGCFDDRKDTSSSCFIFGLGTMTWGSKKQETIALSTSEEEYTSASLVARQALWLLKFLADFFYE